MYQDLILQRVWRRVGTVRITHAVDRPVEGARRTVLICKGTTRSRLGLNHTLPEFAHLCPTI